MSGYAAAMPERELSENVRALAAAYRIPAYHTYRSRNSAPGFPDWVFAGTRVLFRELKTAKGRLTSPQREWEAALRGAGADYGVWRPADWLDGTITAELAAIRPVPRGTGPPSRRPR